MEHEAFIGTILENYYNPNPCLVYADFLEESGNFPLSHAYRWMAKRGLRPHHRTRYQFRFKPTRKVPEKYSWAWYPEMTVRWDDGLPKYSAVPRIVFLSMGKAAPHRLFPSFAKAVVRLADGLELLRKSYQYE